MSDHGQESMEVYIGDNLLHDFMAFEPGAIAGRVPCHECGGTGWWGYGPTSDECGPCIGCKGTGREWVGLL